MKLLLLLSALLSALTGVGAGGRPQQAAVTVSHRLSPAVSPRVAPLNVLGRPPFSQLGLAEVAAATGQSIWRIVATMPLFASRRRE